MIPYATFEISFTLYAHDLRPRPPSLIGSDDKLMPKLIEDRPAEIQPYPRGILVCVPIVTCIPHLTYTREIVRTDPDAGVFYYDANLFLSAQPWTLRS